MSVLDLQESIFAKNSGRVEQVLETVANRYVGSNPPHPMTYRASSTRGLGRLHDYRYRFDFAERFPDMRLGQYVYAWAKVWSDGELPLRFALSIDSPARVYLNGEQVYRTTLVDENVPGYRATFYLPGIKGWNHVVLRFTHTTVGCGGAFGTATFKSMPLHFLTPSAERAGQEGWLYSQPLDEELAALPGEGTAERETGVRWYPDLEWTDEERRLSPLQRLYGAGRSGDGDTAYAWTRLRHARKDGARSELTGVAYGPAAAYVDGRLAAEVGEAGPLRIPVEAGYGEFDLVVRCTRGADGGWGFALDEREPGLELRLPQPVQGAPDEWLYLGPFGAADDPGAAALFADDRMTRVYANEAGGTFWRLDRPDTWVRPFAENPLFGYWNYPLGVTLYGLLESGVELARDDWQRYVQRHIETCTSLYEYALWDKERFGASGVMHTMATLDSLDDCGSFGATMLLTHRRVGVRYAELLGERIARYISGEQHRRPEGMLYRTPNAEDPNIGTVWCDDLYMSVPFLCRYYRLTGDIRYLHDAARQYELYKRTLYMDDQQIMSHVLDYRRGVPTRIPWGRGNGWVLFSLSELLEELPEGDSHRPALLEFFRELCEGYVRLQGDNGLWHQVINDPESYEETSCTSMFLYAFARGVRFGWLEQPDAYVAAIHRGWDGMTRRSIDRSGNVYGVCRGSGYSYTGSYYKDDLPWLLNDTHGIGIVLLAGIEMLRLQRWMEAGASR